VGLGVKRAFDDISSSVAGLSFPLDKPIHIAGQEKRHERFHLQFDPTLAPKGKNAVIVYYEPIMITA